MTVPLTVVDALPLTDVGETTTVAREGERTVSPACCVLEPSVPINVAVIDVETAFDVTETVDDDDPTGIETDAGKLMFEELEESFTATAPLPVPGSAFKVIVAFEVDPPATLVGLNAIEVTWNGSTVIVAVCFTPPDVAVIVTT